jgi:predicted kinase
VCGFSFVVVSGPPGSGKSTLATALAPRLGLPLFSKDTIKESLLDTLGAPDVEASRRLGAAAVRAILALARENGCGVLE